MKKFLGLLLALVLIAVFVLGLLASRAVAGFEGAPGVPTFVLAFGLIWLACKLAEKIMGIRYGT